MAAREKTMAIVAPHFVPSNLAAVHRSRLWSQHLPEFGWKPIIVTSHYRHYEEKLDWDLMELVDPELEVIRTWAVPATRIRLVGDIGLRGFYGLYAALCELIDSGHIDLVHITIPSNYAALLGPLIHRRYGIPFGIDYIDPWIENSPGSERPFTKAWAAARLARLLEPWAVAEASLITGVAWGYFEAVLERHPHLRERAVLAAMPYGTSKRDYELLAGKKRAPFLFDPADGDFHVFYAGAILPRALSLLERLFEAIALLQRREPEKGKRLRFHFAGTGLLRDDPRSGIAAPYAERAGLQGHVFEHAARIPYVDVLNHLLHANANLVLGSTERHYSPSKAYQVAQAGRPILAILHEASTAATFLRDARAGEVVTFPEGALPTTEAIAAALSELLAHRQDPSRLRWEQLDEFSARASARALAEAADRVLDRRRQTTRANASG